MLPWAHLFETITYFDKNDPNCPHVKLGNEETLHPVKGYGWANYSLSRHRVQQRGLFIPTLGNTALILVKQHKQFRGNFFHCENNTATLALLGVAIDLNTEDEISITTMKSVPPR